MRRHASNPVHATGSPVWFWTWEELGRWFLFWLGIYTAVALIAAVLFIAGSGFYAYSWPTNPNQPESLPQTPPNQETNPAVPGKQLPKAAGVFVAVAPTDKLRATGIVGVPIYSTTEKRIGSVKDFILNTEGRIDSVIVSFSHPLYAYNPTIVRVPFKSIEWQVPMSTLRAGDLGLAHVFNPQRGILRDIPAGQVDFFGPGPSPARRAPTSPIGEAIKKD